MDPQIHHLGGPGQVTGCLSESQFLPLQNENESLITSLLGGLDVGAAPKMKAPSEFSYWEIFSKISLLNVAPNHTVFTARSHASCRKLQTQKLGGVRIVQ